jgi:hypothetical protein
MLLLWSSALLCLHFSQRCLALGSERWASLRVVLIFVEATEHLESKFLLAARQGRGALKDQFKESRGVLVLILWRWYSTSRPGSPHLDLPNTKCISRPQPPVFENCLLQYPLAHIYAAREYYMTWHSFHHYASSSSPTAPAASRTDSSRHPIPQTTQLPSPYSDY